MMLVHDLVLDHAVVLIVRVGVQDLIMCRYTVCKTSMCNSLCNNILFCKISFNNFSTLYGIQFSHVQ